MDAEGPMARVPDAGRRISGRSGLLPLRAVDPTLTQDASEQFPTDVALMGVRDPEGHVAAHHELVSPAGVGSLEIPKVRSARTRSARRMGPKDGIA